MQTDEMRILDKAPEIGEKIGNENLLPQQAGKDVKKLATNSNRF